MWTNMIVQKSTFFRSRTPRRAHKCVVKLPPAILSTSSLSFSSHIPSTPLITLRVPHSSVVCVVTHLTHNHHHAGLLNRLTEVLHDIISRPDADHTVMFVDNDTKSTRKSAFLTYSPRHDSMHGFHLTLNLQPPSSERSIGFRACEGLEYHAVRLGGRAH